MLNYPYKSPHTDFSTIILKCQTKCRKLTYISEYTVILCTIQTKRGMFLQIILYFFHACLISKTKKIILIRHFSENHVPNLKIMPTAAEALHILHRTSYSPFSQTQKTAAQVRSYNYLGLSAKIFFQINKSISGKY